MPRKKIVAKAALPKPNVTAEVNVDSVLASLRAMSTPHDLNNLTRFGIETSKGIGVSMANMKKLARHIGRNHALADGLWASGWYEARMLASLIDDPKLVTPIQMDRWCRDFDNWGICDTVCFALFDRTPHAWKKVSKWSTAKGEFQKRAAFALLWGLSVHDKQARDEEFVDGFALIERGVCNFSVSQLQRAQAGVLDLARRVLAVRRADPGAHGCRPARQVADRVAEGLAE